MSRALFTLAFVFDVDENQYSEILDSVDNSVRENIQNVLRAHGASSDDLDDRFEYYGANIHPRWALADFLGDSA